MDRIGTLPGHTFAQAMTIEADGDAAYVIGGWGSDSQCSVYRIELPADLCALWPTKSTCLHVPGCGYCANEQDDSVIEELCHSNTKDCPLGNSGYTQGTFYKRTNLLLLYVMYISSVTKTNAGKVCHGPVLYGDCKLFHNCTTCVQATGCNWCDNMCLSNKTCQVNSLSQCPYSQCLATDCVQCHQLPGCDWSYSKRRCVPCK